MSKKLQNGDVNHGVASVGGLTSVSIAIFTTISFVAILWAIFGPEENTWGRILFASVFGVLGFALAHLNVRWKVSDGILRVSQWGIPKKMKLTEITGFSSESGLRWKQGVGIRWIGPGEWAMLCGSDEVVTIVYQGKKFMFSADDGEAIQRAIARADQ